MEATYELTVEASELKLGRDDLNGSTRSVLDRTRVHMAVHGDRHARQHLLVQLDAQQLANLHLKADLAGPLAAFRDRELREQLRGNAAPRRDGRTPALVGAEETLWIRHEPEHLITLHHELPDMDRGTKTERHATRM